MAPIDRPQPASAAGECGLRGAPVLAFFPSTLLFSFIGVAVHNPARIPMSISDEAIEAAARALCRLDGNPENATMDGRPLWQDYLAEARAALDAALPYLGPQAQ